MKQVIKGCKTIEEFIEVQQKMAALTEQVYQEHKKAFENWSEGEPVKSWFDAEKNICVEYASGKWWHYKINAQNEISWW